MQENPNRKRVVLDTNVLVSGFGCKGPSNTILQKCIDSEFELIISYKQLEELKRVLDYPRLKFTEEQKAKFLDIITQIAILVETYEELDIIKDDPDDNVILESATEGKAIFLISGDPHLLEIKEFRGVKIFKPREFLDILEK